MRKMSKPISLAAARKLLAAGGWTITAYHERGRTITLSRGTLPNVEEGGRITESTFYTLLKEAQVTDVFHGANSDGSRAFTQYEVGSIGKEVIA